MIIKAKKFTLRPYKKGDEESLQKSINDKNIYKYTCSIPYPYTNKIAAEWISRNIRLNRTKNKKEINFAIDVNGKIAGGIGFRNIKSHKASIGYWLGKRYWSKGIMTEALRLAADFGFKKIKLKRIYAHVFKINRASARVLEKNKFKREGLLKKYTLKDGKYIDVISYAKIK